MLTGTVHQSYDFTLMNVRGHKSQCLLSGKILANRSKKPTKTKNLIPAHSESIFKDVGILFMLRKINLEKLGRFQNFDLPFHKTFP